MATSEEFPSRHSVNQVLYSLHLVLFGLSVNDVEWVVNIQMILNTTCVQDNKNKPCTWFLSPGCSSGRHKSSTPSPTSSPPPLTLATRRGRRRRWRGIGTGREGRGRGWGGSDGIPAESKVPSRSRGQGSTMIREQFGYETGDQIHLVKLSLLSQVLCNQLLSWKLTRAKFCTWNVSWFFNKWFLANEYNHCK